MSKRGHFLTATALAYCLYEQNGNPTLAVMTLLASSFPDIAEGVRFRGKWRTSLIPHRTLTHWAPLYLMVLLALPFFVPSASWLVDVCRGLCYGSLLHILIDYCSPAGVPMINPFGHRRSFGCFRHSGKSYFYRTGTLEEIPVIALVIGIIIFLAPRPAPFTLQDFIHQAVVQFALDAKILATGVSAIIHRLK